MEQIWLVKHVMKKLLPRIEGGGGGGCPVLVFGITRNLYVEE
jgi:hypothetical protein